MTLKETIERLMADKIKPQVESAVVASVDAANMTCRCTIEGSAERIDVRLCAITGNTKGFIIVPKVGSLVLVGMVYNNPNASFVMATSEVEELRLNGVNYGGLVIWPELQKQLNALNRKVDALYNAINNGVPAAGAPDGGAGYQTSMKLILQSFTEQVSFTEALENKTVKHGN
jgi:hypothetical protein